MKPWHWIVLGAALIPILFIGLVHFIGESGDSTGSHRIVNRSVAPFMDSSPRPVIARETDSASTTAVKSSSPAKGVESPGGTQQYEPQATQHAPADTTTQIPLSFTKILADIPLSEEESNGVRLIAERFVSQVGPPPIWLGDPGYAERWQKARSEADEALKAVLGWDLFNKVSEAMIKGFSSIEPDQNSTHRP